MTVSYDGGHTWAVVPLPEAARSTDEREPVRDVTTRRDGTVWLSVDDDDAPLVYRLPQDARSWTRVTLPERLPPQQWMTYMVSFADGPGDVFGVLVRQASTPTSGWSVLYTSTDGGRSFDAPAFHEAAQGLGNPVGVVQWSGTQAAAIAGPGMVKPIFTSDAGGSWLPARVDGLLHATRTHFRTVWLVDGHLKAVGETFDPDNLTSKLRVYTSSDGGKSYVPVGDWLQDDWRPPAVFGPSQWSAPWAGGSLRVSADAGASWSTIDAPTLPYGVANVALRSPVEATAAINDGGCAAFKQDCWSRTTLYETTDGGRTWSPLAMPPGAN